jgi:hypothetical protein
MVSNDTVMERNSGDNDNKAFTDDEAALYDRQIRLWGVDAQKRYESSLYIVLLHDVRV